MNQPHTKREQWSGQYGFILAAVGSAIGLGNIWRFPGVAYTNGGGAFLIPYLVALLTAGIPILLLDYSLGHRYRGSSPAVFRRISKKWEALGWFQVVISLVIMTYYAVILAWAVRYMFFSFNEAWGSDTLNFFVGDFLQLSAPGEGANVVPGIFWPLVAVWTAAAIVIALGVTRGLERISRFFIPFLIVIFAALVIRALFLPGATAGLDAFFTPNWAALADPQVWIAAYSQIFFSLSVAFGIMLTYSSYLGKRTNVTSTGLVTGLANSSFEILAGIGVFATLGYMATQQGVGVGDLEGITGPILSFVTFPAIISLMPGGPLFGVLFFASLVIAGFTSLVSLIQVVSAALQEKFALGRRLASLTATGLSGLASVFVFSTSNGLNALDVVDKFINELGIVTAAILMTFLVTFIAKKLPVLRQHLNHYSSLKLGTWWYALVGVVTPGILALTLVLTGYSLITEGYGDYPETFVYQYGWFMIVGVAFVSFVLAFVPWRTPVDDYDPVVFHEAGASLESKPSRPASTPAQPSEQF
ncbi:sodium-dependent transporter [Trueperella pecoris]|uniref:sodium-dependent transporter n=1 Tax=Trueperella pecoris TaxID=2733571 RepID=UPI00186B7504|nr:sodium-dependent transporter [Trueperella pecoris]QOQ38419.1 sodium-dependent transporter [Trueperella pecoris]